MFRHLFVPALLAGAIVGWWKRDAIHEVHGSLIIFIATLLIIFVAEQFFPARREWNYGFSTDAVRAMQRFSRDFVYVMVVTQLSVLAIHFVAAPIEALTPGFSFWPTQAPAPVRIALASRIACRFSGAFTPRITSSPS